MADYQEPSHWTPALVQQRIDLVLLQDKQLEISKEMQSKSIAAQRLANKPVEWVRAEVDIADEWAEKLFQAWKQIWSIQGFPESHAFCRAVYEHELVQLFAGRRSAFEGKCKQFAMVKGSPHHYSAVIDWFVREMNDLASKWNRRVNVEARKSMYAAKRGDPATLSRSEIVRQSEPRHAARNAKISNVRLKLMRDVFGALQSELEGIEYCKIMDRSRPPISSQWTHDGWPGSYVTAYQASNKWRKRIQDQKSKMRRKFDEMTAKEREEIIQGSAGSTRLTR